jgi:hypothetical protein
LAALLIPTIVCAADFTGSVISVLDGDTLDVLLAAEAYSIIGKEQSPTRSTTYPSSAHSRELSYHRPSCTQEEAIRDSVEYSEVFFNRLRHHGTLGYHSTAEFAIQA